MRVSVSRALTVIANRIATLLTVRVLVSPQSCMNLTKVPS